MLGGQFFEEEGIVYYVAHSDISIDLINVPQLPVLTSIVKYTDCWQFNNIILITENQ